MKVKNDTFSKLWFDDAFEGVNVQDYIKVAAAKIAKIYNIRGICDPGYIANTINYYVTMRPTVCDKTVTGEHCLADKGYCSWCNKEISRSQE